jgi:PHD/YefM family antitoxin component YafN of YafNO toxin-antitoxin module
MQKSCLVTWNRLDRSDMRVDVDDDVADLYVLRMNRNPRHALLIDTSTYRDEMDVVAWGDGVEMAFMFDLST